MKLIDQTKVGHFWVMVYGPQARFSYETHEMPEDEAEKRAREDRLADRQADIQKQIRAGDLSVLENDELFERPRTLPREIESPTDWPSEWGCVIEEQPDLRQDFVAAKIHPVTPKGHNLLPTWGIWNVTSGALAYHPSGRVTGLGWTPDALLEVIAEDGPSYQIRTLHPPTFEEAETLAIPYPESQVTKDYSPERLEALGADHWIVWCSDGQGGCFDIVRVAPTELDYLYRSPEESLHPFAPAISTDGRWLAFGDVGHIILADLSGTKPASTHPVTLPFSNPEWPPFDLNFLADNGLCLTVRDRREVFKWPLPQHLVVSDS